MKNSPADKPLCTSTPVKLSASRFLRTLASLKARGPLAVMGLLMVAAGCAGACIDARWFIVALMIPSILLPMVMFFLYAAYALSPRCLHCVHPHKIEAYSDRLRISYTVTIPALTEEDEPQEREIHMEVPLSQVVRCTPRLNELLIVLEKPFGFLLLPYDALSDANALIKLLK